MKKQRGQFQLEQNFNSWMLKVFYISFLAGLNFLIDSSLHATTLFPDFDHIVIVIEENHSYEEVVGSKSAPYINQLLAKGASFSQSYAVINASLSQPNYLALFSGSTQNMGNQFHPKFEAECLGSLLIAAGKTYLGYSEGLPSVGFDGISSGNYVRRHNPSTQFTTLSPHVNQPFSAFPKHFEQLPTVCIVVPNLKNDGHDGSLMTMDTWLKNNIGAYAEWAKTHNSLLIVTFDEPSHDVKFKRNIPTVFYGAHIKPGIYTQKINHYNVLRTIEDMYGLHYLGKSATATPITNIWKMQ